MIFSKFSTGQQNIAYTQHVAIGGLRPQLPPQWLGVAGNAICLITQKFTLWVQRARSAIKSRYTEYNRASQVQC